MLIVALILAVIGLAALISAVVTSNELIAWVCVGASGLGVLLLIVDAIRERSRRPVAAAAPAAVAAAAVAAVATADRETTEVIEPVTSVVEAQDPDDSDLSVFSEESDSSTDDFAEDAEDAEIPEVVDDSEIIVEDYPDELVHDEPDYDVPSDDEAEFPEPAEEAALHIVRDDDTIEGYVAEYTTDEYVAVVPAAEISVVPDAEVETAEDAEVPEVPEIVDDSEIIVEDYPDELVHDEPDYDVPSDDEAEFPEPAEEAALHIVRDDDTVEGYVADYTIDEYVAVVPAAEISVVPDAEISVVVTEGYVTTATVEDETETAEDHLSAGDEAAATEIRYVQSAEGSADTVYTYSESAETEYIEAQDSEVTDENRDQ